MFEAVKYVVRGIIKSTAPKPIKVKSELVQGLRGLFVDELKNIYWVEKTLTNALPNMIKSVKSEVLIKSLEDHLEVTKSQVSRIEKEFDAIGEKAEAKKCEVMERLFQDTADIIESTDAGVIRDAFIKSTTPKVKNFAIATYGTLCSFAKDLGEAKAVPLLALTLNEV